MRIHELLYFFKTYFLLGVVGLIILSLLVTFGYFVIYKRMLKGNKKFSKRKIVFGGLFIVYIIMVFGVTFLDRGANFQGIMNVHFLSSYRDAWNSYSLRGWQFLILNILMFVPFGFLLPLLHHRFQKFYYTLIAALLFTMFIELFQLATGIGIFEFDDIFNNFLGALIGYGIIMAFISAFKPHENKGLKIIGFLAPLMMTVVIFLGVFMYYEKKELGNIAQDYIYKINLKNTNIQLNTSLNEKQDLVPLYKAPTYTKDEASQWVSEFFNKQGIDASNLEINTYHDDAIFWMRGEPTYNISFNYIGGSYSFTDFSQFDDEVEPMNIEEDLLLNTLNDFGINIPEEAEFYILADGRYQWKVANFVEGDILLDGFIDCAYYSDHTIKNLNHHLITYKKVKDVSIKSEKEAFEELAAGKFQFRYYEDRKINDIIIENISLDYVLDTKGFFQPVYSFTSIIDGNEYSIIIPAID